MNYDFTPKYEIGQHIFLNVSDGDEHLITDIVFTVSTKQIGYELMDCNGRKGWYSQLELTADKIIR